MFSVISNSNKPGLRPVFLRISLTIWGKPSCSSWMGEILTEMIAAMSILSLNSTIRAQAVLKTHSPIGTISPVDSAISIKSRGGILPSSPGGGAGIEVTLFYCSWAMSSSVSFASCLARSTASCSRRLSSSISRCSSSKCTVCSKSLSYV